MDSVHVSVPLRGGKRMKKRRELDAKRNSAQQQSNGCMQSSRDQLLTASSDEGGPWPPSAKSRAHAAAAARARARSRCCRGLLRGCSALLVFACAVATTTVMWLFIDIREQLTSLRTELDQAVAGSQGVPDALQKCHSMTRELQGNQTELYKKIDNLTLQLKHYSDQLTSAQGGLEAVQSRLKAAPELESIPQATKDLANSVAKFGSQLQDLSNTVEGLKTQTTDQHQIVQTISSNITALQVFVKKLENMTNISNPGLDAASQQQQGELKTQLSQLISNVTHINDTLSAQLKFTNDDQKADHKKLGALEETDQNVTSRLSTLEEKSKLSPTVPQDVLDHFKEITEQLSSGKTIQQDLSTRLVHLEEEYENVFKQMNTLADNIRSSGQQPPTLQEISSPAPTEAVRGSSSDTVESPKESAPFHK